MEYPPNQIRGVVGLISLLICEKEICDHWYVGTNSLNIPKNPTLGSANEPNNNNKFNKVNILLEDSGFAA